MRRCRNPYCGDDAKPGPLRLCLSCHYLCRWAFLAGAFLAGALVKLLG